MAGRRAGGGRSRMDLRREAEAAEARDREATTDETEEAEDEEDEGDETEAEGDGEGDDGDSDGGDEDDEDAPKKKKKKVAKPKAVKAPAKKRSTRAAKEERMRAVWRVLDNGSKVVGEFPFPQKKEAEELLAAKIEEKKTTFYLQLVKVKIEA
jgi:hypothetical protein